MSQRTRQAQRLARFRVRETVGMPMQPRYQIHLYHDGARYVAAVPELDGCSGTGHSYAEALASAEKAIASWVFAAINQGKPPPEPAKDFVLRPTGRRVGTGDAAPIMRRLHHQFGNVSNRQLAEKLGWPVSPTAFAAAAAGKGARAVRLAIALTLNERPSRLWPHLSATSRHRDDSAFYQAGGLLPFSKGATDTKGTPMDSDERQALYETMIEEYRAMFASMDDAARASWFFTMDESVILSFDVGKDESITHAEERHAVKLQAIATALSGLPCAAKEQRTIEDLQTMASAIHKRHEAQRQASAAPSTAQNTGTDEDPYEKAVRVLKAEGLL